MRNTLLNILFVFNTLFTVHISHCIHYTLKTPVDFHLQSSFVSVTWFLRFQ